jgi:Swt1-like HEPN
MERSLVFELRETGNRRAHLETFSLDNPDRALGSIERLLNPVVEQAATSVRRVKIELRRRRDTEEG